MHHIVTVVLFALTNLVSATDVPQPVQPTEGLHATVQLSSPATVALDNWWKLQDGRLGPPATHLWMVWRLRQLPDGVDGPLVSGCEKLERGQPAPDISAPSIGPGLWQLIATVQTDPNDHRQVVLTAWRCAEIKVGVATTLTLLRLQPALALEVRLALDQPPNPKELPVVGICVFDDHGLVDLTIVEMVEQNAIIVYPTAPEGWLRFVALVLSDQDPERRALRTEILRKEHNLIILPLIRPSPLRREGRPLFSGKLSL